MAGEYLSPDRARYLLVYDKDRGALTWRVAVGRKIRAGSLAGHLDQSTRYVRVTFDGRRYPAHRLAWAIETGAWPTGEIDHINGDRTDNRWSNLRQCQHAENTRNRPADRRSRTGIKGVCRTKYGTYEADITLNGRRIHLGTYSSEHEAAEVRKRAAVALHGKFAGEAR